MSAPHENISTAGRPPTRKRKIIIGALGAVVLAAAIAFGIPYIRQSLNTVSTDDAYVGGHVTFVAPRVQGQIARVLVDDNNRVRKGDRIAELDKQPYEVAVSEKKASRISWRSIRLPSAMLSYCAAAIAKPGSIFRRQRIGRDDARRRRGLKPPGNTTRSESLYRHWRCQACSASAQAAIDNGQAVIRHRAQHLDELAIPIGMALQLGALHLSQGGRQAPFSLNGSAALRNAPGFFTRTGR